MILQLSLTIKTSDIKHMGFLFLHPTNSPTFQIPTERLTIQLNSDTNYLELIQTPQVKGSVPQEGSHFRCQLQVWATRTYNWPTINWGLPWPPPPVQYFARTAHKTQETALLTTAALLKRIKLRKKQMEAMHGERWRTKIPWPLWAPPS